jgi:hypothetical protein
LQTEIIRRSEEIALNRGGNWEKNRLAKAYKKYDDQE